MDSLQNRSSTFFWGITLIEENSPLKLSCYCSPTCSSIQGRFPCWGEIMNQPKLTNCTDFMTNAKENSIWKCGGILPTVSIVFLFVHSLRIRYSACMADYRLNWPKSKKYNRFIDRLKFHPQGFCVIFYGRILLRIRRDGSITMREASVNCLGLMCCKNS